MGDPDLQLCLDVAEKAVLDHLGWDPVAGSARTEYVSGQGLSWLQLKAKNITLSSITVNGVSVSTSLFRVDGEFVEYLDGIKTFPMGRKNVYVTYTAGWAVPSMPAMITHTVLRIANIIRMDKIANGQAQINTPDGGVRTYSQYIKYAPQLEVLDCYRVEPLVA
jgi:hypothetical protein